MVSVRSWSSICVEFWTTPNRVLTDFTPPYCLMEDCVQPSSQGIQDITFVRCVMPRSITVSPRLRWTLLFRGLLFFSSCFSARVGRKLHILLYTFKHHTCVNIHVCNARLVTFAWQWLIWCVRFYLFFLFLFLASPAHNCVDSADTTCWREGEHRPRNGSSRHWPDHSLGRRHRTHRRRRRRLGDGTTDSGRSALTSLYPRQRKVGIDIHADIGKTHSTGFHLQ